MSVALDDLVTIVVSSCDAYEDCWPPFFHLFEKYWSPNECEIVLLTDCKDFSWSSLALRCVQTGLHRGRQLPWGTRLRMCLETITTPIVLYLQEDFFLEDQVERDTIAEFAAFMSQTSWTHQDTMQIGLSPRGSHGPFHLTEHPLLWEVDVAARYRFCLQPGLWNRLDFYRYVRPTDSPWMFEETSHIRGRRTRKRMLTVNRHVFTISGRQVYPFDHRGITRGKWVRDAVVPLFERHGIVVDYRRRGFLEDEPYSVSVHKAPAKESVVGAYWRSLRERLNTRIDRFRY